MDGEKDDNKRVRLDKWLWAARFYKTRALAAEAIQGGHVHVNGARAKPSRTLNLGDELTVTKGQYRFEIAVKGLTGRRCPAPVAAQLYEESEQSKETRELVARERRAMRGEGSVAPEGRPNKRGRRQIIRFIRRGSG